MKRICVVLLVLTAMFATACSSQSFAEPPTTQQTEAEAAPAVSEEISAATASSNSADGVAATPTAVPVVVDEPTPVPPADTSSAAAQVGSDDWCVVAALMDEVIDPASLQDPVALEEDYTNAVALIAGAARNAPSEIAADVTMMAQAIEAMSAILATAEWDFLAVDFVEIERVASGMDVPGFNIEKYNYEVCGLGLDPGDTPPITNDALDE